MPIDFYDILEISEDATQEEIKRAYRLRVKEYHPDLNDHPRAHAQFKVLKKARDVLGDPTERSAYDRLGHREYIKKRLNGELPTMDFPHVSASGETATSNTSGAKRGTAHANGGTSTARRSPMGHHRRTHSRTSSSTSIQNDVLVRNIWMAVVVGIVTYLVGFGLFIVENVEAIEITAVQTAISTTISDPNMGASLWLSERFGVPTMTLVIEPLLSGSLTISNIGVVLGIVLLPICVGGTLTILRRRTTWKPSYLYLIGSFGPLTGTAAHFVGVTALPLDILLFFIIPIVAVISFLIQRFR